MTPGRLRPPLTSAAPTATPIPPDEGRRGPRTRSESHRKNRALGASFHARRSGVRRVSPWDVPRAGKRHAETRTRGATGGPAADVRDLHDPDAEAAQNTDSHKARDLKTLGVAPPTNAARAAARTSLGRARP